MNASPQGYTEAVYLLGPTLGIPASVTVRPEEVSRRVPGFEGETTIHVSFEIRNGSDEEIELDRHDIELDWWTMGHSPERDVRPDAVAGETEVPPDSTGIVHAYFELGPGIGPRPDEIHSFRVRWAFDVGLSRRVVQHTVFAADTPPDRYYFTPWFDPFIQLYRLRYLRLHRHHRPYQYRRLPHVGPIPPDHRKSRHPQRERGRGRR
jgi:hypothetical protein